jgi:hypothetical protein
MPKQRYADISDILTDFNRIFHGLYRIDIANGRRVAAPEAGSGAVAP